VSDFEPDFAAGAGVAVVLVVVYLLMLAVGFVVSAWVTSLFIRLVIRFMRKPLDREYRYMRGDYSSTTRPGAQRQAFRANGF
jgi:hypothetical protein